MKYFKKLVGESVYLSPINPDDYEIYTKWLNDSEVTQFLASFDVRVLSVAKEREALIGMAASGYNFAIIRAEDDTLLGNVSLMGVDLVNRRASVGIFIGEAENHSNGYGAEAIRLVLDYGFNTLGLHNIELSVFADNERAIACYKKVGFRECGRRTEAYFKRGRFIDLVIMEILDREWEKR